MNQPIRKFIAAQYELTRGLFDDQNHIATAREKLLLALPFWIAAAVTALVSILYTKLFAWSEELASRAAKSFGLGLLLWTPILFFISWWLVEKIAPLASGSGIPQLKVAAEKIENDPNTNAVSKLLGLKVILAKIVSSLCAVIGGGATGREGPTLQIAGSIFDVTSRLLPEEIRSRSRHGMVLAGGAAGIAAAFNTPLGGIAYAIEELAKSHLSFFRTGILHAVVVAGLISQLILGTYLYMGYPKVPVFQFSELGLALVVAVCAGLVGCLFGQLLKYIFNFRSTLNKPSARAVMAICCGLVFASLYLFVSPTTFGPGSRLLTDLLFDGRGITYQEFIARFFGTASTYAAGGAAGVFAPTLTLGGALGRLLQLAFTSSVGPLAVLVGMTASLSALTHSPLTSFILILEMTDRHTAIVPIMIAALIGHGVSNLISHESFYDYVAKKMFRSFNVSK